MPVRPIRELGDPVLGPSTIVEVGDPTLKALVADMRETNAALGGVGLAACQIGVPKRVIVYRLTGDQVYNRRRLEPEEPWPSAREGVILNPVITAHSVAMYESREGCFSLPDCWYLVPRHQEVSVEGFDLEGHRVSFRAKGYLARILQHEIDHTNGVLILEHLPRATAKQAHRAMERLAKKRAKKLHPTARR